MSSYNPAPPIVEKHQVEDEEIFVVRDDLCSLFPGPNFSKIRGVHKKLEQLREKGVKAVASQDTSISRCGWGVSFLAEQFDLKHYNFYPEKKEMNFYQQMSKSFGGIMVPIYGTFSNAFRVMAKRWMTKNQVEAEFLPIGLSIPETIQAHVDLIRYLPSEFFEGSVVVCVSSGTICAGIVAGLELWGLRPQVIGVMSSLFKNRKEKIIGKIRESYPKLKGFDNLHLMDSGYKYKAKESKVSPPFPCDLYLDRKAWKYMVDHLEDLPKPVTFWNIGGEWNPVSGISQNLRGDGVVNKWDVKRYLTRNYED